jgi:hypothetical protein
VRAPAGATSRLRCSEAGLSDVAGRARKGIRRVPARHEVGPSEHVFRPLLGACLPPVFIAWGSRGRTPVAHQEAVALRDALAASESSDPCRAGESHSRQTLNAARTRANAGAEHAARVAARCIVLLTMSEPQERPRRILGEAALLALATAAAYLLAFYYETGYASYFGIPADLIAVDLRSLLLFGVGFVSLAVVLLLVVNFLVMTLPSKAHPGLKRTLFTVSVFSIICFIPVGLYGIDRPEKWWWVLIPYIPFLFFQFVYPVFAAKREHGYLNKLAAVHASDNRRPDLASAAAARFGVTPVVLVSLLMIGIATAPIAGGAAAMKRTSFLVLGSKPPRVVLRTYGDTLICAVADLEKHQVTADFLLVKIGDHSYPLTLQDVGPLILQRQPRNAQGADTATPTPPAIRQPIP